ncbi:PilZ domain-containing protein [Sphingomonas sp. CJ20]
MTYQATSSAVEIRRDAREDVHYRARAMGPDGAARTLLVVNISAHGMMVRSDDGFAIGDRIRVTLPVIGSTIAEVRWALGGRIGCQFDPALDLAGYYEMVAVLLKGMK